MNKTEFYCPHALLPQGWRSDITLSVDDSGMIADIRPGRQQNSQALSGVVIPGMVNVHSHIHQRLIAGLTGFVASRKDSFWSWRERMYQAVSTLDADGFEKLSALAFMELVEGGYTTTGEFHYPHRLGGLAPHDTADLVVDAALQAGSAITMLPVWYRHAGFGRQPLGEHQQMFDLSLDELADVVGRLENRKKSSDGNLLGVGVAPHSLRAVDARDLPEMLSAVGQGPVHIHISEQPAEVEACLQAHDRRPIEWLLDNVDVDRRWCLIHATHASDAEWRALAERDVVVGICPTTEADLGDGLFPVEEYMNAGGRIAVGSDSNLAVSAAEEVRLLEWGQRLRLNRRNVLGKEGEYLATGLWQHTALSGAAALDQPAGELAVGKRADFVVLNDSHHLLNRLPPAEQLDSFVFAHAPGMIDQVYVAGRQQVENGRHHGREALQAQVAGLRARLVEGS